MKPSLENGYISGSSGLILIDSLLIFDEFQNRGFGLRALKGLIKLLARPEFVFMLVLEERDLALKDPMSQKGEPGFRQARRKALSRLKRFYTRAGFSLAGDKTMVLECGSIQNQLRLKA